MKKYFVEVSHLVNEWDNEKGEGDNINLFSNSDIVDAESPKKAVLDHMHTNGYDVSPEDLSTNAATIEYACIVDNNNEQDTKGNYIDNMSFTISEITLVKEF